MSAESALEPCPFCGKTPTRKYTAGGAELFIECECGARMFGENDLAVIETWNNRPVLPWPSTSLERAFSSPVRDILNEAMRQIAKLPDGFMTATQVRQQQESFWVRLRSPPKS